ncbi:tetratricopeptide repeat protein [Kutzneria sp. NPDC051319]|uniref:tetratricopeptide repeat protein n=1 Tax=Kutzneria sp. NPDC051319 TaxID=3155047 RepID=UPI00343F7067
MSSTVIGTVLRDRDGVLVDGESTSNTFDGIADNVVQAGSIDVLNVFVEPTAPKAVPWLVPVPPDWFINRHAELALLRDLSSHRDGRTRPVVVALRGMAGVGKSALLKQAAMVLKGDFPDGALHVTYGVEDASPAHAAGRFLAALGVPDKAIPVAFDRRIDLYRTLTADRRAIAVFDDVTDAAQVTALLPSSPQSLVLVAGARVEALEELHVDGAVDMRLEPLADEHAIELLAAVCPDGRIAADPVAAGELVEACGQLPLALYVAASWLKLRPQWGVRRLVEHLAAVDGDPTAAGRSARDNVYSVFDLAYETMSDRVRSLYRLMGVIVGVHFGPAVLAAMSGRPVAEIRDDLDALALSGMVEDLGDDAFRLHRLVRLHALRRAAAEDSDEDRVTALSRAANWWLTSARVADVATTGARRMRMAPPTDDVVTVAATLPKGAGLAWLSRELPNLLAVMRAAESQQWHDLVWQLFEALWPLFDARHPLAKWVEAGRMAVSSARLSGNSAAEVRCRCLLAKAYQELERYSDAHVELDRARELARGDDRLTASTADFLGNVLLREGKPAEALASFQASLAVYERLKVERGTALQSMMVGRALTALGRYDEALAAFDRSRRLIEGSDSESLLPKLFVSTAAALSAKGDIAEAEQALSRVVELAGMTVPGAAALAELSALAERRGDDAAVRSYRARAVELYEGMGVNPRTAAVLAGLPTA